MVEFKIFHLYWKKYSWIDCAANKFKDFDNTNNDFGIYQVYGDHPIYGDDKLLYIGRRQSRLLQQG